MEQQRYTGPLGLLCCGVSTGYWNWELTSTLPIRSISYNNI